MGRKLDEHSLHAGRWREPVAFGWIEDAAAAVAVVELVSLRFGQKPSGSFAVELCSRFRISSWACYETQNEEDRTSKGQTESQENVVE